MPRLLDPPSETNLSDLPGGGYAAKQRPDGTWDILDVPIMGTIDEGERRNEEEIGVEWMQEAIAKAKSREAEGYLAPLHIQHHEFGVTTRRAGFVLPTRVGTVRYEGEEIPALYADLLAIPEDVFASIERAEIPYRSVEIHDWDVPEINSLALLEDEVPFFRFEMLTIGAKSKVRATETVDVFRGSTSPLLAIASAGSGGRALFRLEEPTMKIDPKTGKPIKLADEDETKDEEEKTPLWAQKLLEGMAKIVSKLGVDDDDGDKEADDDSTPVEPDEKESLAATETAKIAGRLAALEQKVEKRDQDDAVKGLADAAAAKLAADGYEVDPKTRGSLELFYAQGESVGDAFVEEFRKNTPKDPPPTLGDLEAADSELPDEVMKFSTKDPDTFDFAKKKAKEFEELKARGHMGSMTLERFLELNVN
jgi:hypothetical protein